LANTKYYIIKNKSTSLWDICTDDVRNPPLEKYRWATDFNTKEEAETYLGETLKKLKEESNAPPLQLQSSIPEGVGQGYVSQPTNWVGIVVVLAIVGFVAYAILHAPVLSATPTLNGTWVNQFFTTVGNARNQPYHACDQLNTLAMENYTNSNLGNNEDILAPLYLETENGVQTSQPYGVTSPNAYLQNLQNNDTTTYSSLMSQAYSYYGYYIFSATGTFGNITASTLHVFVELSPTCG
jgi:hypothetical protein